MKKKDISWLNPLGRCMWCIILPAFSACSVGEYAEADSGLDVPTANYIIDGTVVGEEDTAGIPGLQVVISHAVTHPSADTLFTGNDGKFAWEGPVSTFGKDLIFTITVTDIDNEENNRYAPYTTRISFSKKELDNDISQFIGEARKEILIKMKEIHPVFSTAGQGSHKELFAARGDMLKCGRSKFYDLRKYLSYSMPPQCDKRLLPVH
jgi:putative lipoprotein (rSAM/lipoprotein system)